MKKMIPLMAATAFAAQAWAALPTAATIQQEMGFGINIGNTMEVPITGSCTNMTCWGNPFPTEQYIQDIANAGFSSVRIPTAWYTHSDPTTGTIDEGWLDSVYTVVKMVVDNGMYAFLNSHWDSGWLEDNVFEGKHPISDTDSATTDSALVNKLQGLYWTQIANKFKEFDEHVIFGSANEPGVNDKWLSSGQVAFTAKRMALLNRYHETMISAVRATGGNNATRTIVVQAPRTDEALMLSLLADNMPNDPAGAGYLMAEFHFYPYQFSLMTADESWGNCFYYWGEENYSTSDSAHNANRAKVISGSDTTYVLNENQYAGPAYTDSVFAAIKTAFVDKGYPVVIGEYAAIKRPQLSGENLRKHLNSRVTWYKRVNELSKANGMVPFAWDTGSEGDADNSIILRQKGHSGIYDYNVLNAMRSAYGLDTLEGDIIDSLVTASLDSTNRAVQITYTTERSDSSETGTFRLNVGGKDWSGYVGVSFLAKVDLDNAALDGESYGWITLSPFAMSGTAWTWSDFNFTTDDILDGQWANYVFPLSSSGIDLATPTSVQALGINVYGTQVTGTVTIDNIVLLKEDGSADTLASFNKSVTGDVEGIITNTELVVPELPSTIPTVGSLESEEEVVIDGNGGAYVKYTSTRSDSSETGTIRITVGGADWSDYVSMSIRAKIDVSNTALDGEAYGWTSMGLFALSGTDWEWSDYNFSAETGWTVYTATFGTDLSFADQTNVGAIGLNLYGTQPSGTIVLDYILLTKADGTVDTLKSFKASSELKDVEVEGVASNLQLVTINANGTIGIQKQASAIPAKMHVNIQRGTVTAMFTASNAAKGQALLLNGLGQVVSQQNFAGKAGTNSVQLSTGFRGPAFLIIKQGSQKYTARINLK